MCTPQFMQTVQQSMNTMGIGHYGPAFAGGAPGAPGSMPSGAPGGPTVGGIPPQAPPGMGAAGAPPRGQLPATAGALTRVPPGATPSLPAGPSAFTPPMGLGPGQPGPGQVQPGGGEGAPVAANLPQGAPALARPGIAPGGAGVPGGAASMNPPTAAPPGPGAGGIGRAPGQPPFRTPTGLNPNMPPGAGVRSTALPAGQPTGALPQRPAPRPQAMPRTSLRRGR